MKFKGVLLRFDCTNNKQFEDIGNFWSLMKTIYPINQLKGLGLNWENTSFDYLIGNFNEDFDFKNNKISETYPSSRVSVVQLPDRGWSTYNGKINDIQVIYEKIYKDGPLDYEIEEFDEQDNCKISIFRLNE